MNPGFSLYSDLVSYRSLYFATKVGLLVSLGTLCNNHEMAILHHGDYVGHIALYHHSQFLSIVLRRQYIEDITRWREDMNFMFE